MIVSMASGYVSFSAGRLLPTARYQSVRCRFFYSTDDFATDFAHQELNG